MTYDKKSKIYKNLSGVSCHVSVVSRAAFTLVETILAVAIIGLVITSTAQLTQSSLRVSRTSTAQFAAYHMAEEGLEIVRAIRDSNWLQNSTWNHGLSDGSYFITENSFPWALQKITDASLVPEIILSPSEKLKRTVTVVSSPGPVGDQPVIRVTSAVQYENRGEKREVKLVMELTDWKKGPL